MMKKISSYDGALFILRHTSQAASGEELTTVSFPQPKRILTLTSILSMIRKIGMPHSEL